MALSVIVAILYGCGSSASNTTYNVPASGSGSNASSATASASQASSSASPGLTGTVVVTNNLGSEASARTRGVGAVINAAATDFNFTGVNANNYVLYPTVQFAREATTTLTNVPVGVTSIHVDYTNSSGVDLDSADIPVTVQPGGVTQVSANALSGFQFPNGALVMAVVNDSEQSDSNVYVLLTSTGASTINAGSGKVATYALGTNSGPVSGSALSQMQMLGTETSPLTGRLLKIYGFAPYYVLSGRLYVSYGTAVTFKNDTAPDSFTPNYRFDKMELNYTPAGVTPGASPTTIPTAGTAGYFDLTSLDFFAIPMQLESRADLGSQPAVRTETFYLSTPTLLNQLYNLNPKMSSAFYQVTASGSPQASPGYNPQTDPTLKNFARVLGPQTIAGQIATASPSPVHASASPYPGYASYLQALVNTHACIQIQGQGGVNGQPLTTFSYSVSFASDGNNGFNAICRPNAPMGGQLPPEGALGASVQDDHNLPANQQVTVNFPVADLDYNVYAAPPTGFSVSGMDAGLVPYAANSVYATIAGDVVSGLQFGYVNGRYGNDTANWFQALPVLYPFGAARPPQANGSNDGYYNPYAAIFYNDSDSYGFPYTDRSVTFNPLLQANASTGTPFMRLTLLPDLRLDNPQAVTLSSPTSNSVTVSWKPVTNVPTGFKLTNYEALAYDGVHPPVTDEVPSDTTRLTFPKLQPGTAYNIYVQAIGQANGVQVSSGAGLPAQGATTVAAPYVTPSPTPVNNFYNLSFKTVSTVPSGWSFLLNGTAFASPTPNAVSLYVNANPPAASASPGATPPAFTQQMLVEISGPNPAPGLSPATIVYDQANLFVSFSPTPTPSPIVSPSPRYSCAATPDPGAKAMYNITGIMSDGSEVLVQGQCNNASNLTNSGGPFSLNPFPPNDANWMPFLSVTLNPSLLTKVPMPVVQTAATPDTSTAPVCAGPSASPAASPNPPPGTYWPTPNPTPYTFTVTAVPQSPQTLTALTGASVVFIRTYDPALGTTSIQDAAGTFNSSGICTFDPAANPYNAPRFGAQLHYVVKVFNAKGDLLGVTQSGMWGANPVPSNWTSGLGNTMSHPDKPVVIYVNCYTAGNATVNGESSWGN